MLLLQRLQTRRHPFHFSLRAGYSLRDIAPGAFEFDFGSAARTFVFQLHLVIPNHGFDQLVSREHPLPSALKFSGFLCSNLWPAPAGVHMHYPRSILRTQAEHVAASFLRDQDGAAMDVPMMQIMKRIVGLAELVFFGMKIDETAIRERHQFDQFRISSD